MSILSAASKLVHIDAERARLQAQLRQLNSMRNAVVPIGHLPSELLLEIFDLYSIASLGDLAFAEIKDLPNESCTLGTIFAITHTCSLWRAAAVRCTGFWSTINTKFSPDAVDWLVEKGNTLSLRVLLDITSPDVVLSPRLLANISRIQTIGTIYCPIPGVHRWSTPLLKALSHTMQGLNTFAMYRRTSVGAETTQVLFDTSASTLRVLSLDTTDLPWIRMPLFTNLHTLSLASVSFGEGIFVQSVLEKLAHHSPCLRALFLDDLAVSPPSQEAKICFPSLQLFGCRLSLRAMESLVDSLEIPPDCRISISLETETTMDMDASSWSVHLDGILQLLGCVYSGQGLTRPQPDSPNDKEAIFTFRSIYIAIDDDDILFTAYDVIHCPPHVRYTAHILDSSPIAFLEKRPCANVSIGCSFLIEDDFENGLVGSLTARKLLPLVSLAGVEMLSIGYDDELPGFFNGQVFTSFLMRCTHLRYLRICDTNGEYVSNSTLRVVAAALSSRIEGTDALAAPQLHTLELERTVPNIRTDYDNTALDDLKELMVRRREAGLPLEHVWVLDEDAARLDLVLCRDQPATR